MKSTRIFKLSVLVLAIAAILFWSGCNQNSEPINIVPEVPNTDEQEIYSTVIKSLYSDTYFVVADQSTTVYQPFEDMPSDSLLEERLPNAPRDAIEDFIDKNKEKISLSNNFGKDTKILSKSELESISRDGAYPKQSIVEFSRIGFDRGKRYAIVYTGIYGGPKLGRRAYVILVKESGVWVIKESISA